MLLPSQLLGKNSMGMGRFFAKQHALCAALLYFLSHSMLKYSSFFPLKLCARAGRGKAFCVIIYLLTVWQLNTSFRFCFCKGTAMY